MTENQKKPEHLHCKLTTAMKLQIMRICKKDNKGIGEVVRIALQEYIDRIFKQR